MIERACPICDPTGEGDYPPMTAEHLAEVHPRVVEVCRRPTRPTVTLRELTELGQQPSPGVLPYAGRGGRRAPASGAD